MIKIYDDDFLTILVQHDRPLGARECMLLSFTGIGHRLGGIDVQRLEFFKGGRSFGNVAFITDKTRSWGNRINLQEVGRLLAPLVGDARLGALGNSMGGFLAIAASRLLPIETVVAFVPQFTVDSAAAPIKPRWSEWLGDIAGFGLRDLSTAFQPGCQYWIFSGGSDVDLAHARLFPKAPNIRHYTFADSPHNLSSEFKARGVLYPVITACFAGTLELTSLRCQTGMEVDQISPIAG